MTEKQIIENFEQYVNTQHDEYTMVIEYGDKRNEQIERNLKTLDRVVDLLEDKCKERRTQKVKYAIEQTLTVPLHYTYDDIERCIANFAKGKDFIWCCEDDKLF